METHSQRRTLVAGGFGGGDGGDHRSGSSWTNEKHMNYLTIMEATFVRNMLIGTTATAASGRVVRLDRYVPDVSESTLDATKISRARRQRRQELQQAGSSKMAQTISQDQVVPQIEGKRGDKVGD
ncbi:hypothetical protein AKJ16_DCAP18074 [Drosera capensis]